MEQGSHNKIINTVAKEILQPIGLFRKGQSRTWIDDNGWFFILVEFQPSGWAKGSYLNVGINYLWSNFDSLSFDYGYREKDFIKHDGCDESFHSDMIKLANQAKDKVVEYRGFRDIHYAMDLIINSNGYKMESYELWHKLMISALNLNSKRTRNYANALLRVTENSNWAWGKELYNRACNEIKPILSDEKLLYEYAIASVKKQRSFWKQKSSMKKMSFFDEYDFH